MTCWTWPGAAGRVSSELETQSAVSKMVREWRTRKGAQHRRAERRGNSTKTAERTPGPIGPGFRAVRLLTAPPAAGSV